jgi:hypothetical protein
MLINHRVKIKSDCFFRFFFCFMYELILLIMLNVVYFVMMMYLNKLMVSEFVNDYVQFLYEQVFDDHYMLIDDEL